jgi:hypothetical protein
MGPVRMRVGWSERLERRSLEVRRRSAPHDFEQHANCAIRVEPADRIGGRNDDDTNRLPFVQVTIEWAEAGALGIIVWLFDDVVKDRPLPTSERLNDLSALSRQERRMNGVRTLRRDTFRRQQGFIPL